MAPHIHLCPRDCAHHKAELLKKKKLIFLKPKPDHSLSWPSQWLSTAIKMKCSLLSAECFINWCNLPFFPGAAKHTGLLSRPQVSVTSSARKEISVSHGHLLHIIPVSAPVSSSERPSLTTTAKATPNPLFYIPFSCSTFSWPFLLSATLILINSCGPWLEQNKDLKERNFCLVLLITGLQTFLAHSCIQQITVG